MKNFTKLKFYAFLLLLVFGMIACNASENTTEENTEDTTSQEAEITEEIASEESQKSESIKDELYGDWEFNDGESMPLYLSFREDTVETGMFGKFTYEVVDGVIIFTPDKEDNRGGFELEIVSFYHKDTLILRTPDGGFEQVYIRQKK